MSLPTDVQPPSAPDGPNSIPPGLQVEGSRQHEAGPQVGITNRPPEHLVMAALSFAPSRSSDQNRQTMEALREQIRRELASEIDELAKDSPEGESFSETGELGIVDGFDRGHLTITVGISSLGMTALGVLDISLPADLYPLEWESLGGPIADNRESGDVVLQICTDTPYIAEHVLRRVVHSSGGELTVAYAVAGFQRFTTRAGRVSRREARSLIGFHDGVSNLDPSDPADSRLIFVDPDDLADLPPERPAPQPQQYGQPSGPKFPEVLRYPRGPEPAWTKHGTYLVVRASYLRMDDFDKATLHTQEQAVGRWKFSGAPLDLDNDQANLENPPLFGSTQVDTRVPVAAHMRKANPRGGNEDLKRRVFRRGYPMVIADGSSKVRRGLVFVCFGRTISTQFEFIMRGWMFNPNFPVEQDQSPPALNQDALMAFEESVACGGYYFVPPLANARHAWSWVLPPAG